MGKKILVPEFTENCRCLLEGVFKMSPVGLMKAVSDFLQNKYSNVAARSFISTGIAQFTDNLIFAVMVSKIFFGWSWIQVILCSLTGAIMELLCEIIFSPIGYKMATVWEKENVGKDYLANCKNG